VTDPRPTPERALPKGSKQSREKIRRGDGMTAAVVTATPKAAHVSLLRLYRAELRWIYRRPRTLVVLGLLALIPAVIAIGLTIGQSTGNGPGNGGDALLTS